MIRKAGKIWGFRSGGGSESIMLGPQLSCACDGDGVRTQLEQAFNYFQETGGQKSRSKKHTHCPDHLTFHVSKVAFATKSGASFKG